MPSSPDSRLVYRVTYHYQDDVNLGPARDSRAFKTERGARAYADRLHGRGYRCAVWQVRETRKGGRWEWDLESDDTRDLGPAHDEWLANRGEPPQPHL